MRILAIFILFIPMTLQAYPVDTSIGWGTGISWTQAQFNDLNRKENNLIEEVSHSDVNNRSYPWNLYSNFRFNPYYGIELGYMDFGTIKFTKYYTTNHLDGRLDNLDIRNATIGNQGWYINHVFYVPLMDRLQMLAKAGFIVGSTDYVDVNSSESTSYDDSNNPTGNVTVAGPDFNSSSQAFSSVQFALGLIYKYKPQWLMRLQINQIEIEHSAEEEAFTQWFSSFSIERRL